MKDLEKVANKNKQLSIDTSPFIASTVTLINCLKLPSIGYDDYQVCSMKGVSMYKSSGFCLITSSRVGGI